MTGQITDAFMYKGERYSLVGVHGQGLFTPEAFKMRAYHTSTGCWRGYVMTFACTGTELLLDEMSLNVNRPRAINKVKPQQGDWMFKFTYKNLGVKAPFTGSLLLGKDFITSMYIHMGFQRPIAFKTVLELLVTNGTITEVKDLSAKMEEVRNKNPSDGAEPGSTSKDDVMKWIGKTFSLDYGFD
nr:hypothetical protein [Candidatus Sigynarchaeota archaeon]